MNAEQPTSPEGAAESFRHERPVMVTGEHGIKLLGNEVEHIDLGNLDNPNMGNDAYTEIFAETASGNIYLIYNTDAVERRQGIVKMGGSHPRPAENLSHWALVDANSNKGVRKGQEWRGQRLTDDEVKNGKIYVSKPFTLGKRRSTDVIQITAVNGGRIYRREYIEQYTKGATSDVRERFKKIIEGK